MPKKPESDYEKLRAVWYKKLEREGFEDIETDENNLKSWTATKVRRSQDLWQAKEAYYQMAANLLNDYKFESNVEKWIWEYHADGVSVRDIVKLLKRRTKVSLIGRGLVWTTIKRLEASMKAMYLSGYENRNE